MSDIKLSRKQSPITSDSPTMSRFRRWLVKTAHMIHVYATLFGLVLILFFAVTGFMLNHIEWFLPDEPQTRKETRSLPLEKLAHHKLPAAGDIDGNDKLAIVEALRKEFGITGELFSFDNGDEDHIVVNFKRAGGEAEARIQRQDGKAEVELKFQGWPIVLTDLHRGNRGNVTNESKFTGKVWSVVIDATCVLLLIICGTGFFLWWSLKGRGQYGSLFMLGGGAAAFSLYYWFVP